MPWIAEEKCAGCGICTRDCPAHAIVMENRVARIDDEKCIRCGKCHDICPAEAVRHDGERVPLLLETNRQYVLRLLDHYNTADERQALLAKLTRHFGIQNRVAGETIDWINANKERL